MIIKHDELYTPIVKAFDNQICQICNQKPADYRDKNKFKFIWSDWDDGIYELTKIEDFIAEFEEVTQEIRIMIFKRQLYFAHIKLINSIDIFY